MIVVGTSGNSGARGTVRQRSWQPDNVNSEGQLGKPN